MNECRFVKLQPRRVIHRRGRKFVLSATPRIPVTTDGTHYRYLGITYKVAA